MCIKIVYVLALYLCLACSAYAETSARASATVSCFINTNVEMNVQAPLFIESSIGIISEIPVIFAYNTGSIAFFINNQESIIGVENKCSDIKIKWDGNKDVQRMELTAILLP